MGAASRLIHRLDAESAQTGQIAGTVKDATGATLSGAQVKATGTVTAASFTATTGPDGPYRLSALPAGQYTVEISKEGFQNYQTGFALEAEHHHDH